MYNYMIDKEIEEFLRDSILDERKNKLLIDLKLEDTKEIDLPVLNIEKPKRKKVKVFKHWKKKSKRDLF